MNNFKLTSHKNHENSNADSTTGSSYLAQPLLGVFDLILYNLTEYFTD